MISKIFNKNCDSSQKIFTRNRYFVRVINNVTYVTKPTKSLLRFSHQKLNLCKCR